MWREGANHKDKTCTELPCAWNTYGAKRSVAQPKEIADMEWRKSHCRKKGDKAVINPKERKQFQPSTNQRASLQDLVHSFYNSCGDACAFEYVQMDSVSVIPPEADVNVGVEIDVNSSPPLPKTLLERANISKSVDELMEMSPYSAAEISDIEEKTRKQADSPIWAKYREGLITGSKMHGVYTKTNTILKKKKSDVDTGPLLRQVAGETTLMTNSLP